MKFHSVAGFALMGVNRKNEPIYQNKHMHFSQHQAMQPLHFWRSKKNPGDGQSEFQSVGDKMGGLKNPHLESIKSLPIGQGHEIAVFAKDDFRWGIGTAPGHVEDSLNDGWLRFAKEGHVAGFDDTPKNHRRLDFWTHPQVEIRLAANLGVSDFRLGLDWSRLVPQDPRAGGCAVSGFRSIQDQSALEHYRHIIYTIKKHGMNPVVSLFHHSLPPWAIDDGGWTNSDIKKLFIEFSKDLVETFGYDINVWIPFNEPTMFAAFSYVVPNMWPSKVRGKGVWDLVFFELAMKNMATAHQEIYYFAHNQNPKCSVGVASYATILQGQDFFSKKSVSYFQKKLNYDFLDCITNEVDFIGINYYGREKIRHGKIIVDHNLEYSENGKEVFPDGLYNVLRDFHDRYNKEDSEQISDRGEIPFIVTENGIADTDDYIRPSYLIEHLLAIQKAIKDDIPVHGYYHWTISNNWEWKDGYLPKFGLVDVDRKNRLKRTPLPTYYLYQAIVESGKITDSQRHWALDRIAKNIGMPRRMYRAADGQSTLVEPELIPLKHKNWLFQGK